jgi:HSP20 family protein
VQCAYGSFERRVPLPAPVRSDEAQATYRDGVLKIELPKAEPSAPRSRTVPVN